MNKLIKSAKFLPLWLVLIILSGCSWQGPSWLANNDDFQKLGLTQNKPTANPNYPMPTASAPTQATANPSPNTPQPQYSTATLQTNLGNLTFKFYTESPNTVANFIKLASSGFYDGVKFHRVIKGFMVQTGDPNSKDDDWSNDGQGGPGYQFNDEINQHPLVRGSVAMANAGPNTNGSQFFIVTAEATPWLDGKHTNFGYLTSGFDILDKIESTPTNTHDHPLSDIIVKKIVLQ